MQSQPQDQTQLFENFTLDQKIATTFRIPHLLASCTFGTVQVAVPFRTFFPTITVPIATNLDIHTGAIILPASSTQGAAFQPDRRLDEAGCQKRPGDCRKCSHLIAVDIRLELARKRQYGHKGDSPEQISQGFVVGKRSIPHPSFYKSLGSLLSNKWCF